MFALLLVVILPIPTYFIYCLIHGIPSTPPAGTDLSPKPLPLSVQLTPIKEVQKEEILQGDVQIADQPVVWLPNFINLDWRHISLKTDLTGNS